MRQALCRLFFSTTFVQMIPLFAKLINGLSGAKMFGGGGVGRAAAATVGRVRNTIAACGQGTIVGKGKEDRTNKRVKAVVLTAVRRIPGVMRPVIP